MTSSQPIHTRRSQVTYRRFSEDNIRRIVDEIANEYEAAGDDASRRLSISIEYDDETSYELENARPVSPDIAFTKFTRSIDVRLALPDDRRVNMNLTHGKHFSSSTNMLVVSGRDLTWVNGITSRVLDIVEGAQAQPKMDTQLQLAALVIAAVYTLCLLWIIRKFVALPATDFPWWFIPLPFFLFYMFASAWLQSKAESMWPVVELQTGPKHTNRSAIMRKRAWLFFSVFAIPVITATLPTLFIPNFASTSPTSPSVKSPDSEPKNVISIPPLELSVIAERPRIRRGETQVIHVRVRNRGLETIAEVLLRVDAPGFMVQESTQWFRFVTPDQEQERQVKIVIDQEVPPGKYDVRGSGFVRGQDRLAEIAARGEFVVE